MGITGGDSGNGVGDGVVNKEQREKLRELALEATPGEWKVASDLPAYAIYTDSGRRVVQTPNQNNRKQWGTSDDTHGIDRHSDAAYIAAANPVAVLALLDRIDELEAAAEVESEEPVAWFTEDHLTDKSATTYSPEVAERWRNKGWPVDSLYRHPPSAVPVAWKLETEGEHIRVVVPDGAVWVYPDRDAGERVIHAYLHAMLAATGDSHHE